MPTKEYEVKIWRCGVLVSLVRVWAVDTARAVAIVMGDWYYCEPSFTSVSVEAV